MESSYADPVSWTYVFPSMAPVLSDIQYVSFSRIAYT